LQKRGLLKDTIIAVTGDHGEAFGDLHPSNFLHKNFTYDENIREFVLLYDGRLVQQKVIEKPIVSARVGSNGDLMPTLLAMLGAPAPELPGRNLLTEDFETRPVFFYKIAGQETWGLRDGRWKYIGEIRTGANELYDLSADPTEQRNIAPAHPDKVSRYRDLCQEWYLASEREFTLRLKDYRMTDSLLASGDTGLGARVLAVGTGETTANGWFMERSVLHPMQAPMAWTKWALDPDAKAQYEWISPRGDKLISSVVQASEWHLTYARYPGALPMQEGVWSLRLREKGGVHLAVRFTVSARAPLRGSEK
jgi:hypothetical protein